MVVPGAVVFVVVSVVAIVVVSAYVVLGTFTVVVCNTVYYIIITNTDGKGIRNKFVSTSENNLPL